MSQHYAVKLNGKILPEIHETFTGASNKLPDVIKRYVEQNHSRSGNLQYDIVEVKLAEVNEVPKLEVLK